MNQHLFTFLKELESYGIENDRGQTDKAKRMRNVTPETGEFLSFLVTVTNAKNVLEVGTSNGYSTLWLADSVSDNGGKITTLEYSEEKAVLAKRNFEQAGMEDHINLHIIDAGQFISDISSESIDMIFLDSDRKEYVEWWGNLYRILKKNGLIIVDNVTSHFLELEDFIQLVSESDLVKTVKLDLGAGILMITKK